MNEPITLQTIIEVLEIALWLIGQHRFTDLALLLAELLEELQADVAIMERSTLPVPEFVLRQ